MRYACIYGMYILHMFYGYNYDYEITTLYY